MALTIDDINDLLGGTDDFLNVLNKFISNRSLLESKAKHPAFRNLLRSNTKLLQWCESMRDFGKLNKVQENDLRFYLNKMKPKLDFRDRRLDFQIQSGNEKKDFDKDDNFEPGLSAILSFVRYADDFAAGRRQKISPCSECGMWFEWSGRGYANKYCSRKCRNKANYKERKK